jgi:hypothetical protein
MKPLYYYPCLALVSFLLLISCNNRNNDTFDPSLVNNPSSADGRAQGELPEMKFDEEFFDFGDITQEKKVTHSFRFTNTGKSDLIIGNARGSCGCTIPDYPTKPIPPGESADVTVSFNPDGKHGFQNKQVTIVTNCRPSTKIISIKANVLTQ